MKAVILAGGIGTRLSEETVARPKPMVEIGGRPIIWHIMKIYAHYGVREFIICLGYKGYLLKEYFANYYRHTSDVTVDTDTGEVEIHRSSEDAWRVTLVETGFNTMTGGRIKQIRPYLGDGDFFLTYGDGVASINLDELAKYHREARCLATVTAVAPPGRFGALEISDGVVRRFSEKPKGDGALINGGFFVLSPRVIDYIDGDDTVWEGAPMERLAKEGQLAAYHHDGFWQAMDTLRDLRQLEAMWASESAKWKVW